MVFRAVVIATRNICVRIDENFATSNDKFLIMPSSMPPTNGETAVIIPSERECDIHRVIFSVKSLIVSVDSLIISHLKLLRLHFLTPRIRPHHLPTLSSSQ